MSESSESLKFPSGDVALLAKHTVTKAPLTYIVSSVALSLASPVWKKFLFPPWESVDNEVKPKQIDCTEDDSSALLILLNVAHLQFNKVPNGKLEYDLLFEVAKLCDQYDCMDLVRPWVAGWLKEGKMESMQAGKEGWLFIAWAFGKEKVFEALTKKLVKEIAVNEKGIVLLASGKPVPEQMPPGIFESIFYIRQTTIKSLISIPNDQVEFYRKYFTVSGSKAGYACFEDDDVPQSQSQACDDLNYGSLLRNLEEVGLWPLPCPERIQDSIGTLAGKLNGMKFAHCKLHKECHLDFTGRVKNILDSMGSPVLAAHRMHMKVQNQEENEA